MGGSLADGLAAVISVGAGIYLLAHGSPSATIAGQDTGQSWFEILAHGIGAYFIAKGIFMYRSSGQREQIVWSLRHIHQLLDEPRNDESASLLEARKEG